VRSDELIKAGHLAEAVTALNQEVKDNPEDVRLRTMLFELLCVIGQWERAERALAAMAAQSVEIAEGVVVYQKLLQAEAKRRQCLQGAALPKQPVSGAALDPWLAALKQLAAGGPQAAAARFAEAETGRRCPTGRRHDADFADLRDADDRFAAVLEVLLGEDYLWLPLAALRTLRVYPPRFLRDVIFAPAMVDWGTGVQPVFLPVRYPDSEHDTRSEVQLARRTTTVQGIEAPVLGLGQRVFLMDDRQIPLLELDLVQFTGERRDAR